jgi:hypothetical protein
MRVAILKRQLSRSLHGLRRRLAGEERAGRVSVELHHVRRERQFLSADTGRCDRAKQRNGRHLQIAHDGQVPKTVLDSITQSTRV